MAMVTVKAEPQHHVFAFSDPHNTHAWGKRLDEMARLNISSHNSLKEVITAFSHIGFGGTDCSLPMIHAMNEGIEADVFVIYTDNQTWAGKMHPVQALRQYRQRTGIPAKLIVVGMVSNSFSIADPDDGGMMDVVGFDTAAPAIMSDFVMQ